MKQTLNIITYILLFGFAAFIGIILSCLILAVMGINLIKGQKMNIFDMAFKEVLGIEGGYVDNKNDNGGETKYGISKRSYPDVNIESLTIEQAKHIYYRDFWNTKQMELSLIDDEKIAIELFDTAVNMGVGVASKFLQEALNLMNRNQKEWNDLVIDGFCGVETLKAYKKARKDILLKVLNGLQFCKYKSIVENNPSQEVFFNGWMKRV